VSIRGDGGRPLRYIDVAEGVHLRLDEDPQTVPDVLARTVAELLGQPREVAWVGVSLPPRTMLSNLDLWLAARFTGEVGKFMVLTAQEAAVKSGIVAPSWRFGAPAALVEGTFSYRSALNWTGRVFDLGASAHGPSAAAEAGRMVEHMRAWLDAGSPTPALDVTPVRTPDGDLPDGTVLDKRHSRIVLTFPTATPQKEGTI
jgi:protein-L-isoaspartate(D-aspartate) O-methyltransferase